MKKGEKKKKRITQLQKNRWLCTTPPEKSYYSFMGFWLFKLVAMQFPAPHATNK